MKEIFKTYRPEGFSTVNPYLMTKDPQQLIDWLVEVFEAVEHNRTVSPEGIIKNAILKIGDSCMMIAQASEMFEGMSTCLYLFVNDVDLVYEKAIKSGGIEIFPPEDMDYGDRQGGIQDPAGNYWWISKRLTEADY